MRPPIIVLGDDVDLFETVVDAERYLEAPDVRSGNIKEIYDRDGRKLCPVIVKGFLGAERVKIEEGLEPPDGGRFHSALVQLLTRSTEEPSHLLQQLLVDELLVKAMPFKTR